MARTEHSVGLKAPGRDGRENMKRKPKFRVGQVVRLSSDYISSFGWQLKSGTLCEIIARGTTWDARISFRIAPMQEPLELWVAYEQLRPLTKRERG